MAHACSPHLPACASPAVPCAPRSLSPACGPHLTAISQVEIDQINKPFLPVAAGRISPKMAWALVIGSGASSAGRASTPCPPRPWCAVCTCCGLLLTMVHIPWRVQVRRAWRWSRRSSARSSSGCTSSAPPSVDCTRSPPSRQASLPSPRLLPPLSRVPRCPCLMPPQPRHAACGVRCGAHTQAAPTDGIATYTMRTLPTHHAHSSCS